MFFSPNLIVFFYYFLAAPLPDPLDFSMETGTFTCPWDVLTVSILTISPGTLYFCFLAFTSLNFLYFLLIYLAASCAFFPPSRFAISSKVSMVSLISESFVGISCVFSLKTYCFLVLVFLTFDSRFSFLKSVESSSALVKCSASPGISFVPSF